MGKDGHTEAFSMDALMDRDSTGAQQSFCATRFLEALGRDRGVRDNGYTATLNSLKPIDGIAIAQV